MKNIVVLAATCGEIAPVAGVFSAAPEQWSGPWDYHAARLGATHVIFTATGVGTANAAAAATSAIHLYSPDLLVITGCAGAYPGSGLAIGDLALATAEYFADEGVAAPEGWQGLESMGLPLIDRDGVRLFNEIPLSRHAAGQALRTARDNGIPLRQGRFVTVSTCSGTRSRGAELRTRFGGLCENMEGAAVALIAARFGIDCLEVRAVSNLVEDRDLSRWDIPRAVAAAQGFIEHFLREYH